MAVSAHFYVQQIAKNASGYTTVTLAPSIKGEHNKDWSRYTPSGKIEMNINPESSAGAWFEGMLGQDVEITFDTPD